MPCAFKAERPRSFRKLSPGCQFTEETAFHRVDGHDWCQFHMPVEDERGHKTAKGEWTAEKTAEFNKAILAFIEKAKNENKAVDLSGVVFPGAISFDHFSSPQSALPPICFFRTRFERPAQFDNANFKGLVSFLNSRFQGAARFYRAQFKDGVSFDKTYFHGSARFSKARFLVGASFRDVHFERHASFGKTSFGSTVRFNDAHFGGTARFQEARFEGNVSFNKAHFESHASFSKAHFDGNISFQGHVKNPPSSNGETNNEEREEIGNSFYAISFAGARFTNSEAECVFSDRRFLSRADFSGATFHSVPKFHESRLHQDTRFRGAEFHNTRSKNAPEAYRTLKLAMEELRAWDEANIFYALERKSWLQQKDTPLVEKMFAWLYELGSYYGTKILRPLGWLALVTFVAFVVYDGMLETIGAAPEGSYKPQALQALIFTIEQFVRPFAVWTADYLKSTGGTPSLALATARTLMENFPFWARVVATVQSVVSLALVALFLLALRRRFKMG